MDLLEFKQGKRRKRNTKNCSKGYPCGNGCITRSRKCRRKFSDQASSYAGWLKKQGAVLFDKDKKSSKTRDRNGLTKNQQFHYDAIFNAAASGNWSNPKERQAQFDRYQKLDAEASTNKDFSPQARQEAKDRLIGYKVAYQELFDNKGNPKWGKEADTATKSVLGGGKLTFKNKNGRSISAKYTKDSDVNYLEIRDETKKRTLSKRIASERDVENYVSGLFNPKQRQATGDSKPEIEKKTRDRDDIFKRRPGESVREFFDRRNKDPRVQQNKRERDRQRFNAGKLRNK